MLKKRQERSLCTRELRELDLFGVDHSRVILSNMIKVEEMNRIEDHLNPSSLQQGDRLTE